MDKTTSGSVAAAQRMRPRSGTLGQTLDLLNRRILRTHQAAEYTGLSASTLEKLRGTGGGPPFVRLGGRAVGYDIRDLDAWLDSQRGTPSNGPGNSQGAV